MENSQILVDFSTSISNSIDSSSSNLNSSADNPIGEDYTPLHYAVSGGHYMTSHFLLDHGKNEHVKLLISKGAEVDAASSSRGTPLRYAVAYSMKDAVKILLEHKANPNYASHPELNPLIVAIQKKSVDCNGADPNLGDVKPLTMAVYEGDTEIIKCLLKAGADPNATNFSDDLTPIEIAAMEGNLAVAEILFDVTARISHIPTWSFHGIYEYINSQEAKNQRELKAETKFLEAKENGAQAVKRNDYMTAVYWYTEGTRLKPTDATVYSNRSRCFSLLNEGDFALRDANYCIRLEPHWYAGHCRLAEALMLLKDYKNAIKALGNVCKYHALVKGLRAAYSEALAELQAPPTDDFSRLSVD
ncbi:hypothetical protein SOVF_030400 isoform B [Spinacia oleracea]|nr:hypothetical protein SOVF_030400 isoform B [Spinacia oleracea]